MKTFAAAARRARVDRAAPAAAEHPEPAAEGGHVDAGRVVDAEEGRVREERGHVPAVGADRVHRQVSFGLEVPAEGFESFGRLDGEPWPCCCPLPLVDHGSTLRGGPSRVKDRHGSQVHLFGRTPSAVRPG